MSSPVLQRSLPPSLAAPGPLTPSPVLQRSEPLSPARLSPLTLSPVLPSPLP